MLAMRVTTRTINTKFGRLEVYVYEAPEGYTATVSDRHTLPGLVPHSDEPMAQSEEAALAQLARAVERVPDA